MNQKINKHIVVFCLFLSAHFATMILIYRLSQKITLEEYYSLIKLLYWSNMACVIIYSFYMLYILSFCFIKKYLNHAVFLLVAATLFIFIIYNYSSFLRAGLGDFYFRDLIIFHFHIFISLAVMQILFKR